MDLFAWLSHGWGKHTSCGSGACLRRPEAGSLLVSLLGRGVQRLPRRRFPLLTKSRARDISTCFHVFSPVRTIRQTCLVCPAPTHRQPSSTIDILPSFHFLFFSFRRPRTESIRHSSPTSRRVLDNSAQTDLDPHQPREHLGFARAASLWHSGHGNRHRVRHHHGPAKHCKHYKHDFSRLMTSRDMMAWRYGIFFRLFSHLFVPDTIEPVITQDPTWPCIAYNRPMRSWFRLTGLPVSSVVVGSFGFLWAATLRWSPLESWVVERISWLALGSSHLVILSAAAVFLYGFHPRLLTHSRPSPDSELTMDRLRLGLWHRDLDSCFSCFFFFFFLSPSSACGFSFPISFFR
jgi:hypothetical protein